MNEESRLRVTRETENVRLLKEREAWKARALRAEAAGEHVDALLAKAEERAVKAEAEVEKWKSFCKALVYPSVDVAKVLADTRAALADSEAMR